MSYTRYKVNNVDYIFIPDPPTATVNSLYAERTADYSNNTTNPTDLVSGVIVSTGADLIVQATGFVDIFNAENAATVQGLVEDAPDGFVGLYIDGVVVPHCSTDIFGCATFNSGLWFQGMAANPKLFKKVTGLAPGAHTIAIKAALYATPPSGAFITCFAALGPNTFFFNMFAQEV